MQAVEAALFFENNSSGFDLLNKYIVIYEYRFLARLVCSLFLFIREFLWFCGFAMVFY